MATSSDQTNEFIPVNQILNAKPQLGPIPGEQVIPWICIAIVAYLICQMLLSWPWWTTLLMAAWGISTWWILTGNESWRYLSKFRWPPTWSRGHLRYTPQTTDDKALERNRSKT